MTEQSNYRNSRLGKIALGLMAVALVTILGVYESIPVKQPHATGPAAAAPDPTTLAIHDLQTSQQQAVDQLNALQQTVSSGQAEARRLSEEVTGLARKLEALQQSFASAPAGSRSRTDRTRKAEARRPDNRAPLIFLRALRFLRAP
jgi:peptidoglycan hydrolase CwlO-like protein